VVNLFSFKAESESAVLPLDDPPKKQQIHVTSCNIMLIWKNKSIPKKIAETAGGKLSSVSLMNKIIKLYERGKVEHFLLRMAKFFVGATG
jgi:hypothetical protein